MNEKERNLSVTLRPRRLSELIGQESLVRQLKEGMSKRIPVAIMLTGGSGAGKTTIAKILGNAVQCTHAEFGEPCDECLENSVAFNVIYQNCGSLGTLNDMRELLPGLDLYPSYGKYRVIILDEAHGLGPKAQEALLIPTEDEGSQNIFIFCSTDPTKIKETIKRRCISYAVPLLSESKVGDLVKSTIQKAGEPRDAEPLITELLRTGTNAPGFIINAVEQYLNGSDPSKAVNVKEASNIDQWALVKACTQGNWSLCQRILSEATPADADGIKLKLSWNLRKILLDAKSTRARLVFASNAIHEMSQNNASTVYEAGLQLSILTASIFKITEMVQQAVAAAKAA